MKRRLHGVLRSLLLAGILLLQPVIPLPAQQPLPIPPLPKDLETKSLEFAAQKQSLADMVASLSRQIGRSIVVDDEPLLKQAEIEVKGTAKEILDKVADLFDYSWSVNKRGAVIMVKRYKDPLEYPQMNLPDLKRMAKDALTVLKFRNFGVAAERDPSLLNSLYTSFTPEQKQRLISGQTLYGKELTREQRDLIEAASINVSFGELPILWGLLENELNALHSSMLQLGDDGEVAAQIAKMKNVPTDKQFTFKLANGKSNDPNQLTYCWKDTFGMQQYNPLSTHSILMLRGPRRR